MGFIKNIKKAFKKQQNKNYPGVQALKQFAPEVVLHAAGPANSAYQVNMWLPVLEELSLKVAIVTRKQNLHKKLLPTSVPIFLLTNIEDLSELETAGVKTILYPASPMQTLQCLRFYKLNHFFINHGESDKAFNQNQILCAYDKILLAGPLAKKRLTDANFKLHPEQVEFVGRPQVNLLLDAPSKSTKDIQTILYAPTWEGFYQEVNYTSVTAYGVEMIKTLLKKDDFHIIFKPHPFTGTRNNTEVNESLKELESFKSLPNFELVPSDNTIYECMNRSDLMITDISSTIGDYIYTEKPMILTNAANKAVAYYHQNFYSTQALYFLEKACDASILIDTIIQNDSMSKKRLSIKKEILGDFSESYLERFEKIIVDSL